MIKQAKTDPQRFEAIIDNPSFLAQKMRCEYYSAHQNAVDNFYFINNCGIMVMGENVSLCGDYTPEELDTILSFCRFMGVYGLETDKDNLPINSRHIMNFMVHNGVQSESTLQMAKDSNLYGFSQFCANNFEGTDFNTIYSYFARKVNRGFSHTYYIELDGKIVCGALSTNYGDRQYLTFVSTDRKHRKAGLASQLINCVVSENLPQKTILMCENELVYFYEKLGFEKEKEIYLYTLREEQI